MKTSILSLFLVLSSFSALALDLDRASDRDIIEALTLAIENQNDLQCKSIRKKNEEHIDYISRFRMGINQDLMYMKLALDKGVDLAVDSVEGSTQITIKSHLYDFKEYTELVVLLSSDGKSILNFKLKSGDLVLKNVNRGTILEPIIEEVYVVDQHRFLVCN